VTLNSASGDIVLRLPHAVDTDVTIRSNSGKISTAFPKLAQGGKTLTGRIGGGMASLTVSTISADVTLLKGEKV
jgi:hypothetical protein